MAEIVKVIYKYHLENGLRTYGLPKGSQILSVAMQHDEPVMWAEVTARTTPIGFVIDSDVEHHTVLLTGTGHSWDVDYTQARFLGTILSQGDHFVLHAYEILK